MMMYRRSITATLLLICVMSLSLPLVAQKSYLAVSNFRTSHAVQEGSQLRVVAEINLDDIRVAGQDLIILVPSIQANHGEFAQQLPPLFIAGSTRAKVIARESLLGHPRDYMLPEPVSITTRRNGQPQTIQYVTELPYSAWMDDAALTFDEWVIGCAECEVGKQTPLATSQLMVPPVRPDFRLTYIVPAVEPVKRRADRYTATVQFHVDRDRLDPSYGSNRQVLDDLERKVVTLMSNDDLTITEVQVIGYASPEAPEQYNKLLSERRARAIADYMAARHGMDRLAMEVIGQGEDWQATREWVERSSLQDRAAILDIIDKTPDLDSRDALLKQLSSGSTYQQLLTEVYPHVRRTEFVLSYIVRGFDLEEARQIVRTNPKLLSLNELYLVAKSYPSDSPAFKEVFDIAARLYPDDPVAIINASAKDIEGGNYTAAIERLNKIADNSLAWNNLAVAYAHTGDFQKAEAYLERAQQVQQQQEEVRHNQAELQKILSR